MRREVELLVMGHVTRDEFSGGVRWGGAAAYGALAAARLGIRTALVTAAPPRSPLLDELYAEENLVIHAVPASVCTTFALDYRGSTRRLSLLARAPSLRAEDIPAEVLSTPVVYVGPVAGECDAHLVASLAARAGTFVGVGLQGWLRRTSGSDSAMGLGVVGPALDETIFEVPSLGAAALSEHDHPEAELLARRLAARGVHVALTRGVHGASVLHGDAVLTVPAAPAREIEPTGAGDVFGVVFTWELGCGATPVLAAERAAVVAARVVEGPGLGTLARGALPLSTPRGRSS